MKVTLLDAETARNQLGLPCVRSLCGLNMIFVYLIMIFFFGAEQILMILL